MFTFILVVAYFLLLVPALLLFNRTLIYAANSDFGIFFHALGTAVFGYAYVKVGVWLAKRFIKERNKKYETTDDKVSADRCPCDICHGLRHED